MHIYCEYSYGLYLSWRHLNRMIENYWRFWLPESITSCNLQHNTTQTRSQCTKTSLMRRIKMNEQKNDRKKYVNHKFKCVVNLILKTVSIMFFGHLHFEWNWNYSKCLVTLQVQVSFVIGSDWIKLFCLFLNNFFIKIRGMGELTVRQKSSQNLAQIWISFDVPHNAIMNKMQSSIKCRWIWSTIMKKKY